MKFILVSDVHNEFEELHLEANPDLGLVIAGDFHVPHGQSHYSIPMLETLSLKFKWIVYVLGNHEFYGGRWDKVLKTIKNGVVGLSNVHVLENESVVLDGVKFIGSTMWTDFNKGDPFTMFCARQQISDFHKITFGRADGIFQKLSPDIVKGLHHRATDYIFDEIKKTRAEEPERKIVVVTHHAPCLMSVHPAYAGDPTNGAYASDLGDDLLDHGPDLWVHGHMHHTNDYTVGNTRVRTNPRGYVGYSVNPEFDPKLIVEI